MSRVLAPAKTKDEAKKAEIEKDKKRAEALIEAYAELQEEKAKMKAEIDERVKPFKEEYDGTVQTITDQYIDKETKISESITEAHKELLEIGARQRRTLFGTNGNWNFDNGYYLHVKSETKVKTDETFNLLKFMKKWGAYVDVKFKISDLKKLFMDSKQRAKIMKFGFDLDTKEEIEVKKKAVKEDE